MISEHEEDLVKSYRPVGYAVLCNEDMRGSLAWCPRAIAERRENEQ
jgi:hypothetical protein